MIERISRRPAPSLRSAAAVTGRCRLKVEKKARKASSSLFCDSSMSQDGIQVHSSAYISGPDHDLINLTIEYTSSFI